MNNTPEFKPGQSAVWTAPNGDSRSVTIKRANDLGVEIIWRTGPLFSATAFVPKADFDKLVLFPEGCKFMVLEPAPLGPCNYCKNSRWVTGLTVMTRPCPRCNADATATEYQRV